MSEELQSFEEESTALEEAAQTVIELQQDGTLDDLTEAATAISLMGDALDDEMIMSVMALANQLGMVADGAAQENTVRTLQAMMDAMDEANAFDEPEKVGLLGAAKKMRDDDVKRGLGFLLAFLGALGRQIERRSNGYEQS